MLDCIETERSGWLTQRGMKGGPGFLSDEFELDTEYPWLLESRRAASVQQRRHEADGGSTLASSDFFSEQLWCASSEGLIGLLLQWEKNMKARKKETAGHLLEDWLDKCLMDVKIKGFKDWYPPSAVPACKIKRHGGVRSGGYCGEVWKLLTYLQKPSCTIKLDELCRLLRSLHAQAHECATMKCWRNHLIREVGVSLQQSLGRLPFVRKPAEAILQWHMSTGAKGKLKDVDEDLDVQEDDTSGAKSLMSNIGKKNRVSSMKIYMPIHTSSERVRNLMGN